MLSWKHESVYPCTAICKAVRTGFYFEEIWLVNRGLRVSSYLISSIFPPTHASFFLCHIKFISCDLLIYHISIIYNFRSAMKSSHLPASVLTEEEFAWAVGIVKSRSVILDNQVCPYRLTLSRRVFPTESFQPFPPTAVSFRLRFCPSLSSSFFSTPSHTRSQSLFTLLVSFYFYPLLLHPPLPPTILISLHLYITPHTKLR